MKPKTSLLPAHLDYLRLKFVAEQHGPLAAQAALQQWDHLEYLRRLIEGQSADIVPLTDAGQLLEEGRAQRNCVGGYALRVASGKVFVYRVLRPERATLSLHLGTDGEWELGQLLRACNLPVSPATTIAALRWLSRESVSI